MESVAECMARYFVRNHSGVPCSGQAQDLVVTTYGLVERLHCSEWYSHRLRWPRSPGMTPLIPTMRTHRANRSIRTGTEPEAAATDQRSRPVVCGSGQQPQGLVLHEDEFVISLGEDGVDGTRRIGDPDQRA